MAKKPTYEGLEIRAKKLEKEAIKRKRAEEALRQSEERYRSVVEGSIQGILIHQDFIIQFANQAAARIFGYSAPEELIGLHAKETLVAPEEWSEHERRATDVLRGGKSVSIHPGWKGIRKDGTQIWVQSMANRISWQGRPAVLGFFVDVTEHKIAEEALRESEGRYRRIVETAQEGIWMIDAEGKTIYVNQQLAEMFGYTVEEMLGLSAFHFIDDYSRQEAERRIERRKRGIKDQYDFQFKRKDGSVLWATVSANPMFDNDGQFIGNFSMITDISDRRRTEEALRESEKRYRTLFENVPVAVYRTVPGVKGKFLMANPTFLKMFGLDSEEELKKKMAVSDVYMNPEERKAFSGRVLAEGRVDEVELLLRKKGGTPFWGSVSAGVVNDENVKGDYFDCTIMDITARKLAEEALRESEEKYRITLQSIPEAVSISRQNDGFYFYANEGFSQITGYSMEDIEGKISHDIGLFVNPADREELIKTLKEKGKVDGFELQFRKKEGTIFDALLSARALKYGDEDCLVAVVKDITPIKEAEREKAKLEAQLLRAQKMEAIGTLAGGVAHDLNNILSGLVSYPELLLMEIPQESPLRKPILTIQKSGERAATIVQDLLTLARRGVAVKEVVNLNHIIYDYLKSPEHEKLKTYHPMIQVEPRLETDLLNILGSPAHLSKTVMNLVSNASEAMPDGGKVFILTENRYIDRPIRGYDHVEEGDYVVLSVSDTGIGIFSEDMERVFEPFYTKKVMGRSGTGLGMTVVWGSVKDHKGYIDVQSIEGKGTTFTLYFPVTRKGMAKDESLSIEDYMGKGESILVVDDVGEQGEIASRILKKLNYAVTSVSSGEEAVEYLKDHTVNLIVLDMIMDPGIDGLDTYKQILELHPGQKAIIASGFSETERVKEAQRLGAGQYIKKPFILEKIGLAIKGELEK